MQTVLLEDAARGHFGPLTLLRPEFELRCGALKLREKLERRRPDWDVVYCPRPELAELVSERHPGRGLDALADGPAILLYGRVVVDEALLGAVEQLEGECLLTDGSEVLGARLERDVGSRLADFDVAALGVEVLGIETTTRVPARVASYPWDLVGLTPAEIVADATIWGADGEPRGEVEAGAVVVNDEAVFLREGSIVRPGAVLDARGGPILLGRGVEVMHGATVVGPAALGDGSILRCGASVTGGASMGPMCKVGGEIQASVIHSHSNKQHGGFLGHSYVGSWVNLGAATDNSDLKNNYGNIRVELDGDVVDTCSTSVGATIGDHSKTAIGTKLNTGTIVGIFCSVLSQGFPPKVIPSFSWGTADGLARHELDRALETATRVMARRGEDLTPALAARVTSLYHALK